jgi:anti-sigma-K factor RskA
MFTTAASPTTVAQPRRSRRRTFTLLGAGAALAASVLVFATLRGSSDPAVRTVALTPVGDVPGRATIEIAPKEMHLVADGLPQLPPKSVYEAWLGRADGSMVSVGTFTVDTAGHVDGRMALTVNPSDFSAVDVSVEPNDGDPTHSTRSVFHAAL